MIAISEDSLHKIKNILNKTIPNCEVRAFGSRVNGTNREYSDLDLAIVGEKGLEFLFLEMCKKHLWNLPFPLELMFWTITLFLKNFGKLLMRNMS